MTIVLPNFSIVIPELVVLGMLCVILVVDLFLPKKLREISYVLTQATLIAAGILTLLQLGHPTVLSFHDTVIRDDLSSILKIAVYLLMFFALLYSREYNKSRHLGVGEFYVLALASVLGMMVMISAHHFITIYLGVELLSLPLYAMIAMRRDSDVAPEGAIKYFVTGALASGILLYGLSILFGATGTMELSEMARVIAIGALPAAPTFLGMVFVVVALVFKFGAIPFHMWVPDVYHGAPTSVTAMISSAPKIAVFGVTIRLLAEGMPAITADWGEVLTVVAFLSMLFGNLLAISQTNLKRMFAYSSIAHVGYMLLGLIAGTDIGYASGMLYILSYSAMALGGFGLLAIMSKEGVEIERIDDLRGLNSRSPWFAFLFLILLFSMAGIPPTLGLFAKLGVIEALIRAHFVWLSCFAVLFAVIGAYYYIRVVKVMYFEDPLDYRPIYVSVDANVAASVNAIALLLLGIFPSGLITLCRSVFGV